MRTLIENALREAALLELAEEPAGFAKKLAGELQNCEERKKFTPI